MNRHLEPALTGGGEAVAQQLEAAGIDLHGRDHGAEAPRGMTHRGVHGLERRREIAATFLQVPQIVEPMTGRHMPFGVSVHRRSDRPDAGLGQQVEPTIV